MTEFYFPDRYDENEAEEGVWFDITDERGQSLGKWKCSLFDRHSTRVQHLLTRHARKQAKLVKAGKANKDSALASVFVEVCVHDWEMKNPKGEAIPFTKDNAVAYLTHEKASFASTLLIELASDVLNFQGDPEAESEEDLGNSESS